MINFILQIPDWENKTAQEIADILNAPSIEYIDEQLYTWAGVALIAGPIGAESFRVALEQNGMGWAVHQLGGSGIQLSNPLVQQVLLGFAQAGVPGAQELANAGQRLVSILEFNNLPVATEGDVQDLLNQHNIEFRKKELEDNAVNRLQIFREALSVWDGVGEGPVL